MSKNNMSEVNWELQMVRERLRSGVGLTRWLGWFETKVDTESIMFINTYIYGVQMNAMGGLTPRVELDMSVPIHKGKQ